MYFIQFIEFSRQEYWNGLPFPSAVEHILSKLGKQYIRIIYCHPTYLTYIQSISWETLGCKKQKLESRFPGELSATSDMQWHHPYGRKWRGAKEPLGESERGVWKSWLKINIQKTKIMASGPTTSWQIDGETLETVSDFTFLGSKITADGDCSHEIKRLLLLGKKKLWQT